MGALFTILLIPLIVVLILLLFFGIYAFAWLAKLWYAITGRKPANGSGFHFNVGGNRYYSSSSSSSSQGNRQKTQSSSASSSTHRTGGQKQKIFSKDEGEYVDFEIVE